MTTPLCVPEYIAMVEELLPALPLRGAPVRTLARAIAMLKSGMNLFGELCRELSRELCRVNCEDKG